jgi:hypothetical protein
MPQNSNMKSLNLVIKPVYFKQIFDFVTKYERDCLWGDYS